ncbi:MAG: ABC transporter ATP-binding protein [Candidatus Kapabacteria bacterium]|nr:ABC transporter ATP-binding protein [Ignavibacteriota bacterium]MCW5883911.1 ABC transporter ATP-binding protein [Candidatus Kapabacteria bacterium]
MIILSSLEKIFQEGLASHKVLDSIDFEFEKGKIYIMFGRSGSGKSTLLNLISGIDTPSSGSIFFKGEDITKLDERGRTLYRRNNIGFIFQFFNLIPTLTVLENLLLPLELVKNLSKSDTENSMQLLSKIGLVNRANAYPDRLSGGEQQRVAIARALIHNPDVILADEPTGNLDYETGKSIVNLLDDLVRKQGKTMIMATHSRDVIGLADYILKVRDGKIEVDTGASGR